MAHYTASVSLLGKFLMFFLRFLLCQFLLVTLICLTFTKGMQTLTALQETSTGHMHNIITLPPMQQGGLTIS